MTVTLGRRCTYSEDLRSVFPQRIIISEYFFVPVYHYGDPMIGLAHGKQPPSTFSRPNRACGSLFNFWKDVVFQLYWTNCRLNLVCCDSAYGFPSTAHSHSSAFRCFNDDCVFHIHILYLQTVLASSVSWYLFRLTDCLIAADSCSARPCSLCFESSKILR